MREACVSKVLSAPFNSFLQDLKLRYGRSKGTVCSILLLI